MTEKYIHTSRIKVRDYEIDAQGIVNNANYLHYLELTRHDFCEEHGYSFAAMHADGLDPVVRRVEMDYLTSLRMGDEMVSCLNFRRRGARFYFDQDIYRSSDMAPVLRAVITIVCLEDGRMSRGERLAAAFADCITEE
ncbi:MAG: acyl-CoA thioesterase [Bacteroides sp.]|nr:acyl-CoA thioesterase [Bacteroidales bacterium]MBD5251326.1 acyl-CoA thioesterase [Barnesiella sp.]MBD5254318.1 acyl-CoA thioesterase [Barnesiella sp.]MBD5343619.1 acyl-CoA thioesterase [Bacteroides sp.]MBD5367987.1 acyl-CoA thioesterase [Bacteroides sp.]